MIIRVIVERSTLEVAAEAVEEAPEVIELVIEARQVAGDFLDTSNGFLLRKSVVHVSIAVENLEESLNRVGPSLGHDAIVDNTRQRLVDLRPSHEAISILVTTHEDSIEIGKCITTLDKADSFLVQGSHFVSCSATILIVVSEHEEGVD